jgi:hypothetical protein
VNELYVPNENLLRVIAGGIVAWFVLLGVLWALRAPRRAPRGPDSTELGSEQPAVANLLAHRFNPTRDAVPATLVDLAARGLVEIEDRGIGRYYCRVTGKTAALTPYERRLVEHLRSAAAGGVVPAEALTTGPQDRSQAWWNELRKEVVAHAQSAGRGADRWHRPAPLLRAAFGAVLLVLYGSATGFHDADDVADSPLLHGVTFGGLAAAFVLGAVVKSKRQTSTEPGLRAASRWLGVKHALEESPSFELLPPSGVVVWERHLAYAAALGVAPRSIHALPMGAESDTEAWTATSGDWRKVRVRYPRLRPGWGRHPLLALAVGSFGTFVGYNVIRVATGDIGFDNRWLAIAGTVATAVGVLVLGRSLPQVAFGLLDLFSRRRVTGVVLRARTRWSPFPYVTQTNDRENVRFFVALDDGRSLSVTAYRVKPSLYDDLPQGAEATLDVTPNLGYVRRPSA